MATRETFVIIGGGINGVMTAYFLLKHKSCGNKRIVLVESNEIAGAASGFAGGFLAKDWHSSETSSLAKLSFSLHEQLALQYNGEESWEYRKLAALSLEASVGESGEEKNTANGKRKSRLSSLEEEIADWIDVRGASCVASLIGDTSSTAQVTPKLFTKFFFDRALELGLEYIQDHVVSIDRISCSVFLEKRNCNMAFDKLVVAAGPWVASLLPDIGKKHSLHSTRAHSILVETAEIVSPFALFTDISRCEANGISKADPEIFPRPNRKVYVCGGSAGLPSSPAALPDRAQNVKVDESVCIRLYKQVSEISPLLKQGVLERKAACYLPFADRPVIGKLPDCINIYVAAGAGVWGITLAPGTGKILSEIILDNQPISADIRLLHP